MKQLLGELREKAMAELTAVEDAAGLDSIRVKYLGKKGELTAVLKQMGKLSAEERPVMGQLANEIRAELEQKMEERKQELAAIMLERKLKEEAIDVTMPGKGVKIGHKHPMYLALDEIKDIFIGMGFTVLDGPRWSWLSSTSTASTPRKATPPVTGPTPSILIRTAA